MEFLPITKQEMLERGIAQPDFVYVIGDAYVDHPSFGHAIISRILENHGYSVVIISQPDWRNPKSIDVFGRPRLGFLVSGGNMDSMVNHYSVTRHRRKTDSFTPGGVMGKRPDYATVVYCNLIRQTYKDVPILIGGIEASLRRLAHYDYWSDAMKRSILLDSQADLLMYGMGERSIIEIADALNAGMDVKDITYIDGTVFKCRELDESLPTIILPGYEELQKNRRTYAESFKIQYGNCDPFTAKRGWPSPTGRNMWCRTGLQGLHPRCRRPHRQLPAPRLRKADDQGCLRRTAVPLPHPLQEYERRPQRLCGAAAQAPENSRGQEGLRSQRHSL